MAKNFTSKILTYPISVREEIDRMIKDGISLRNIRRFLRNYKEKIGGIPDLYTLERYSDHVKGITSQSLSVPSSTEITDSVTPGVVVVKPDIALRIVEDKKGLLESLILRCQERLELIDTLQKTSFDKDRERILRDFISETRQIVETLAKLSGEINEDKKVVVNIAQVELSKFFKLVYDVVKEVCPEKMLTFQELLKKKYMEQRKEEVISDESNIQRNN